MSDLENKKFPIGQFETLKTLMILHSILTLKSLKIFPEGSKTSLNILRMISWIPLTEKEDGR